MRIKSVHAAESPPAAALPTFQESVSNGVPRLSVSLESLRPRAGPGAGSGAGPAPAHAVVANPARTRQLINVSLGDSVKSRRTVSLSSVRAPSSAGSAASLGSSSRPRRKTRALSTSASSLQRQQRSAAARMANPGRVRVAVRVRPPFKSEAQTPGFQSVVRCLKGPPVEQVALMDGDVRRDFVFDQVFGPETTQDAVYQTIGRPMVNDVLNGFNGTLMAYGQTGTGKTYTLGILQRVQPNRGGIVSRALEQVFSHIETRPQLEWVVSVSFLQIYMDSVQDMLNPARDNLPVREDPERGFFVEGLREWKVSTLDEATQVVNSGLENRIMAPTMMNTTSSRSHTILSIQVEQTGRVAESEGGFNYARSLRGRLMLVDLAGSERVKKSQSDGTRLSEAKSINQSLAALGNVISALSKPGGQKFVPFRDTKLTRILHNSLGGNTNTYLIATIGPSSMSKDETVSTLSFATRCMDVLTYSSVNEDVDYSTMCARLQAQVSSLEAELGRREHVQVAEFERKIQELTEQLEQQQQLLQHGPTDAPAPGASAAAISPGGQRVIELGYKVLCDMYDRSLQVIREAAERSHTSSEDAPAVPAPGAKHPPVSDFAGDEALADYMKQLRDSIAGNLAYLAKTLEAKDSQHESVKHELVRQAVEKEQRDEELVNWSFVLKYLLSTNATLRNDAKRQHEQLLDTMAKCERLQRLAGGSTAVASDISMIDCVRLQRAVAALQRRFRKGRPGAKSGIRASAVRVPVESNTTYRAPVVGSSTQSAPVSESSTAYRAPVVGSSAQSAPAESGTQSAPVSESSTAYRAPVVRSSAQNAPAESSTQSAPVSESSTAYKPPVVGSSSQNAPAESSTQNAPVSESSTAYRAPVVGSSSQNAPAESNAQNSPSQSSTAYRAPVVGSSSQSAPADSNAQNAPSQSSTAYRAPVAGHTPATIAKPAPAPPKSVSRPRTPSPAPNSIEALLADSSVGSPISSRASSPDLSFLTKKSMPTPKSKAKKASPSNVDILALLGTDDDTASEASDINISNILSSNQRSAALRAILDTDDDDDDDDDYSQIDMDALGL